MGGPFTVEFRGVGKLGENFRSLRDGAQLLHHPERIPANPFLYDFAIVYTIDDDAHPTRPFVGWL